MIQKQKRNLGLPYYKIQPTDHKGWLIERENGVGASEVGGLIDCSKYTTPYRIWRKKLGLDANFEESWAMRQGHIFESYIAQLFEEEIGYKVIKASAGDWLAVNNEKSYLRVSPDWIYYNGKKSEKNKCILECKTSRNNYSPDCLADECLSWYCQVQYQMGVLGAKEAYLGFLNVETGNHWFEHIEFDEKFYLNTIVPAIERFWFEYVVPAKEHLKANPNCSAEELIQFAPFVTGEDVAAKYPKEEAGKSVTLGKEVSTEELQLYIGLKSQKKEIESTMKVIENNFKTALQDAECCVGTDGKPVMTYKANKASLKFDEDKFKGDYPDIYSKYQIEKAGARILRIK